MSPKVCHSLKLERKSKLAKADNDRSLCVPPDVTFGPEGLVINNEGGGPYKTGEGQVTFFTHEKEGGEKSLHP